MYKTQVGYRVDGCCSGPPAASTTEGLANQLHKMLTADEPLMYPNPIDEALKARKLPFIESKAVLVIMDSHLGATPSKFPYLERVLSQLDNKDTIKHVYMYKAGGHSEKDTPFDMGKFSDLAAQHLPEFYSLNVRHTPVCNFRVESKTLKILVLIGPDVKDGKWEIKCPNLVELEMQNHTPPVKNFGRALVNCPRIETYFSHKYWNNETLPILYLPNCTKFTFRRGDQTFSLRLYLPKVKELNLDACYDLKTVEMLTKGHVDHAQWNLAPDATPSKFRLSLSNANVSAKAKKSLRGTGRVLNPSAFDQKDCEDGNGMDGVFAKMHRMGTVGFGMPGFF